MYLLNKFSQYFNSNILIFNLTFLQRFCDICLISHINDLKEELGNINENLETSAVRFEDKINNFQVIVYYI